MQKHIHMTQARSRPRVGRFLKEGARGAGFTLVEILVVIAIILVLAGLGVFAAAKLKSQSKQQTTVILLQQAANASTEYQAQTKRTVNDEGNSPINWGNQRPRNAGSSTGDALIKAPYRSIERFVSAGWEVPAVRKVLKTQAKHLTDKDGDGFMEIKDAWGVPLKYRQQTGPTDNLPQRPRPFFVSAGPDKKFGSVSANGVPNARAKDNLYSFELNRTH